jgi:hypothetical protein
VLGLTLRDPDQSLLEMAAAMLALGSVTPRRREAEERP